MLMLNINPVLPLINQLAAYVPKRRMRKLHIGLLGYSRSMGECGSPRAIDFQIINFTRPEGGRRISYTSTTDNAVKLFI
jgi:hypothetical protein